MTGISTMAVTWSFVCDEDEIEKEEEHVSADVEEDEDEMRDAVVLGEEASRAFTSWRTCASCAFTRERVARRSTRLRAKGWDEEEVTLLPFPVSP